MKESYKRQRQDDDLNQPLSVQSWGRDGDKRRFWLIEGQDDTHFRLYRESNPALKHCTWRSVAGTIDEVKEVAHLLGEENSILAKRLKDRIMAAIPRFEASEDVSFSSNFRLLHLLTDQQKRKRRDYRLARKAQFTRPDPGFSLYEGRTRGKRLKYTYSDEEDGGSDAPSTRRSNRQSGISTPAEPSGPTFTASGRQVRSRHGGAYGEPMLTGQVDTPRRPSLVGMDGVEDDEDQTISHGRPRRPARQPNANHKARSGNQFSGYNSLDSMDDESDATSSGEEWDGGDDEEPDDQVDDENLDEDLEMSDNEDKATDENEDIRRSLVVSLRYIKNHPHPIPGGTRAEAPSSQDLKVPPVLPPVPEKLETSYAAQHAPNSGELNEAEPSHDQCFQVSDVVESMKSVDELGQRVPENGHSKGTSTILQVAAYNLDQAPFGTEDHVMR